MFEVILALCGLALALFFAGRPWFRRLRARRRTQRALAHGRKMEDRAAGILRRLGYRVTERHPRAEVRWWVDGVLRTAVVEVDYVAKRRGRRFAVEVKTGKSADPNHRHTRRQLLEYAKTYAVDGLLLLDADAERLYEVRFDPKSESVRWGPFWWGLTLGFLAANGLWLALR
jgi:Holliday junction resolvase-like predicted endonuclease